MTRIIWLALAGSLAALAPLLPNRAEPPEPALPWPVLFEGKPLKRLPPAAEDTALAGALPRQIARFSDGDRQIVLRRLTSATRTLHPARDCFRALGYAISPMPIRTGEDRQQSACFNASRDGRTSSVCEQVRDADGHGFPDISGWYWSALFGRTRGPWLAVMTVERTD